MSGDIIIGDYSCCFKDVYMKQWIKDDNIWAYVSLIEYEYMYS